MIKLFVIIGDMTDFKLYYFIHLYVKNVFICIVIDFKLHFFHGNNVYIFIIILFNWKFSANNFFSFFQNSLIDSLQ